ncbi:MAG: 4Fe-4S dicluster domain-containing protein, partial [Kiritimatiellia bacterium]
VFRLTIDPYSFVRCGLCSGVCPAQCLDGKGRALDDARCVRCFNCIGACPKGAIALRPAWTLPKAAPAAEEGRRAVVRGLAAAAGGLAVAGGIAGGRKALGDGGAAVVTPPGATVDSLRARCTACGLCVAACPQKVIAPAGFSAYGPLGFMLPKMDFARGFCAPDCTTCGEVCPTGAILPLTAAEKKTVKIGLARFDRAACLACTEKIPCGLCARRCPQQAITLTEEEVEGDEKKPVKIKVPAVDAAKCTGCGACENYCPAHAMAVAAR